jgi:choline dehydrogenase-like flavoprotein
VRSGRRLGGVRGHDEAAAFNHARTLGRAPCAACGTCDLFACAIEAKNDLATAVLPHLLARGLALCRRAVAVRLVARSGRVRELECVDRDSGRRTRIAASIFVLAAGTLASPHLILASRLEGGSRGAAAVFGSALAGAPPLYVVSLVAGVARFRFGLFVALTLAGRLLRFAVAFGLPRAALAVGHHV